MDTKLISWRTDKEKVHNVPPESRRYLVGMINRCRTLLYFDVTPFNHEERRMPTATLPHVVTAPFQSFADVAMNL